MWRYSGGERYYWNMESTLTPTDEKALAAKADRDVSGDLFVEVKALIASRLASWRGQFDEDDIESMIGEIYVGAVKGFEAGRAPFLSFLSFHANRYMLDRFRTSKRPKAEFLAGIRSLERTNVGRADRDHGNSLRDVIESKEPTPDAPLADSELRADLVATIEAYTDRPEVWAFLKSVNLDGDTISASAAAAGFGRVWGQNVQVAFLEFARTHSRLQAYREGA